MGYVVAALSAVTLLVVALAGWRFITLRSKGTSVTLRRLPAQGLHGWRHGLLRYNGDNLKYYMLRSLAPSADIVFSRTQVQLQGHRVVESHEASFLSAPKAVLFSHQGTEYELVCSPHAEMAFTAWVEAAPDSRMEKMSPKALRKKMNRGR